MADFDSSDAGCCDWQHSRAAGVGGQDFSMSQNRSVLAADVHVITEHVPFVDTPVALAHIAGFRTRPGRRTVGVSGTAGRQHHQQGSPYAAQRNTGNQGTTTQRHRSAYPRRFDHLPKRGQAIRSKKTEKLLMAMNTPGYVLDRSDTVLMPFPGFRCTSSRLPGCRLVEETQTVTSGRPCEVACTTRGQRICGCTRCAVPF